MVKWGGRWEHVAGQPTFFRVEIKKVLVIYLFLNLREVNASLFFCVCV